MKLQRKEDIQIFTRFCKPKEILDQVFTELPEFHQAACMHLLVLKLVRCH